MKSKLIMFASVLVVALVSGGCGGIAPTPTPFVIPAVPTHTLGPISSPPETPTLSAAPTSPAVIQSNFPSGGLGLSLADWEQQHGAPDSGGEVIRHYEHNKYIVTFWDDRVMLIERQLGNSNTQTLEECQREAHAMLPADAQLVETHKEQSAIGASDDDTIEVYTSPTLIARYTPNPKTGTFPWFDGGPGSLGVFCYGHHQGWSLGAGYANP